MARILLVAQDDVLRGYLAKRLLRQGHVVSPMANAREAIAWLVPGAFRILITEARMDDIDGPELARRAVATVPGLRILFLDGFGVLALRQGALPALDEACLLPRFHLNSIIGEIDNLLAA